MTGIALAALALAGAPGLAGAATFTVTSTDDAGPGTLRQAIADAQANAGPDAIAFDARLAGRQITLSAPLVIDDVAGALAIDGSGAPGVAVSGARRTALLDVRAGDVTIRRLTLRDGVGAPGADGAPGPDDWGGNGGDGGGAAIFNRAGATLRLVDAIVAGNVGGDGGDGAYGRPPAAGGGGGGGGAIVNAGTMAITGSTLVGNVGGDGGDGASSIRTGGGGGAGAGALTNAHGATLTIVNSTFAGNRGGDGGDGGDTTATASGTGGGGGAGGAALVAVAGGVVEVTNTTFIGNVAGAGGSGGPSLSGGWNMGSGGGGGPGGGGGGGGKPPCCTTVGGVGPLGVGGDGGGDGVAAGAGVGAGGGGGSDSGGGGADGGPGGGGGGGNGGRGQGGAGDGGPRFGGGGGGGFGGGDGGWIGSSDPINPSRDGGPGLGDAGALLAGGDVTMTSTALAGSEAADGTPAPDCRGTVAAGAANLLQLPAGCERPTGDELVGDPLLGALGDHGGPTPTAVPAPHSPLRDAGANPLDLAHDQRGDGFPRVIGAPDIGAVEGGVYEPLPEPPPPPPAPEPPPPAPAPPPPAPAPPALAPVALTERPAARHRSRDVTVAFEPVPGAVGYECRLDNGPWAPCTSPWSATGVHAGDHVLAVRAIAADGRRGPAALHPFQLDVYAPGVAVRQRTLRVRAGKVRLRLSCSAREGEGRGACITRLTVRRRVGGRSVVVARGRARLEAGEERLVTLRLTPAGGRLAPARRAGAARLTIDRRDLAGNRGTLRLSVRLR